VEQDRAKRVIDTLENEGFGLADEAITPIPSYDLHGFGFSEERYWRGPVWINIDWFLMHGLEAIWLPGSRKASAKTIIELCKSEGFHEYFDPLTGRGLGSILFSWSAALLLDVLMEDGE
jgi:glycogen debranching enzyme